MKHAGIILTYVFIFAVAGGHWGVMQLVAWSSMASAPDSGSFLQAVAAAPCEHCFAVAEGSQKDKNDPRSAANAKGGLAVIEPSQRPLLCPPPVAFELDDQPHALAGIKSTPPHGPPRAC